MAEENKKTTTGNAFQASHIPKKQSKSRKRRRPFIGIFADDDTDVVEQQRSQCIYQHYQLLLQQLQQQQHGQQPKVQPQHRTQAPSQFHSIQTSTFPAPKSTNKTEIKSAVTATYNTVQPRPQSKATPESLTPVRLSGAKDAVSEMAKPHVSAVPAVPVISTAESTVANENHDVSHLLPAFVETAERLFRSNFKAVQLGKEVAHAEARLAAAAKNLKEVKARVTSHECEMRRLSDAVRTQSVPINKAQKLDLALGMAARNLVESLVRGPSTACASEAFDPTNALPAWLENWSDDDPWWAVPDWIRDVLDSKKPMLSTTKLRASAMLSTRQAVEAHLMRGVSISSASQTSGVHRRLLGRLCKMADAARVGANTSASIHRCLTYVRAFADKVNASRKQKKQKQSPSNGKNQETKETETIAE